MSVDNVILKTKCLLEDGETYYYQFTSVDENPKDKTMINAYNLKYLGKGVIYSIDNVKQNYSLQNSNHIRHFWGYR